MKGVIAQVGRHWVGQSSALVLAVTLGLAGCVTTETVSSGGDSPGASGVSSRGTPAEEQRRRAGIRLQMAVEHYQQGNMPLALQDVDTSIQIDRNYPSAYGIKALIYAAMGDREQADGNFRQAIKLAPKDAEINNNYGWYLCQTGREREAISHFEVAIQDRHYPTPAKPLHNAGVCLKSAGDDTAAEDYLLRAFRLDPTNAVAMFHLADLYLKRGNYQRAKFYSDRLLSTYEPTAETLWLGLRVARLGNNTTDETRLADRLRNDFPQSREAEQLDRRTQHHDGY